jgi:Putative Flp pilus-assembly TadE/G-like/von Willebrand factor type A domain
MMIKKQMKRLLQKKDDAQIIVIFAIALVAIIAFMGFAIDLGDVFVAYSRLTRATDAAALAATSQFREGYTSASLIAEAQQFLDLNGVKNTTGISIESCETNPGDPQLCTNPPRKLVRVVVSENVPLYFLSVVGIRSLPITVRSLSEAASVDLVLLIDRSTSMAENADGTDADPSACNPTHSCHPFEEIKSAAEVLVNHLLLSSGGSTGYDRVAIVTFDRFPHVDLAMTYDKTQILNTIDNLTVYQAVPCPFDPGAATVADPEGPCRSYNPDGSYWGIWSRDMDLYGNPTDWMVTNSGGGLKVAANLLGGKYPAPFPISPTPATRPDALWVVVWLTDGFTNAGFSSDGNAYVQDETNSGTVYCPAYTWVPIAGYSDTRYCVDQDARDPQGRHALPDPNYDPDDYARDMVDFLTNPSTGQGALLFTIGLGNQITDRSPYEVANNFPPPGQALLEYGADKGNGIYYPAPNVAQLNSVFLAIANKIATRLSQ